MIDTIRYKIHPLLGSLFSESRSRLIDIAEAKFAEQFAKQERAQLDDLLDFDRLSVTRPFDPEWLATIR